MFKYFSKQISFISCFQFQIWSLEILLLQGNNFLVNNLMRLLSFELSSFISPFRESILPNKLFKLSVETYWYSEETLCCSDFLSSSDSWLFWRFHFLFYHFFDLFPFCILDHLRFMEFIFWCILFTLDEVLLLSAFSLPFLLELLILYVIFLNIYNYFS